MTHIKAMILYQHKRLQMAIGFDWQEDFKFIEFSFHECEKDFGLYIAFLSLYFKINIAKYDYYQWLKQNYGPDTPLAPERE